MHDRNGPSFGILYGRLDNDNRFIANIPNDKKLMKFMTQNDFMGKSGFVKHHEGINIFSPD